MKSSVFPTVELEDKPQHCVVTDDPKWGHGIFSMHVILYEAKHNARITGGKLVPIDYVNGEIIPPPLALAIRKRKQEDGAIWRSGDGEQEN